MNVQKTFRGGKLIKHVVNGVDITDRVKMRGLGDVAHAIANPIAKASDKLLGTKLAKCGGCKKRRKKWNKAVPFKRNSQK